MGGPNEVHESAVKGLKYSTSTVKQFLSTNLAAC